MVDPKRPPTESVRADAGREGHLDNQSAGLSARIVAIRIPSFAAARADNRIDKIRVWPDAIRGRSRSARTDWPLPSTRGGRNGCRYPARYDLSLERLVSDEGHFTLLGPDLALLRDFPDRDWHEDLRTAPS